MDTLLVHTGRIKISPFVFAIGGIGIIFSLLTQNIPLFLGIVALPVILVFSVEFIKHPIYLLVLIFTLNYYLLGITRYVELSGLSFLMDILMGFLLTLIFIHSVLFRGITWKPAINVLTIGTFIWMCYCLLEIGNPTALTEAWVLSRGLTINGFVISLAISLLCTNFQIVKTLVALLSVFTLTAVIKAIIQKYIGFDYAEFIWLSNGGALTHLISTGTRYFSFFTDAGNFGSNMGCACIIFTITAFHVKKKIACIYYLFIAMLSLYAMFLSGTRGAMIVPVGGLALFTIISKNIKALITGSVTLVIVYIFFAFTSIGQENVMIRRMRTAFNPTEDASFNVRKANQEKLAIYLKNKPFGEGLGLAGVENQKVSKRFTTSIPHDSWYIKIWVETGIVGLVLYISIMLLSVARGSWLLMFKVRDRELRGRLTALLCGIFGMFLSAYGNAFLGQFPTSIIAFTGLALVLKASYFQDQIDKEKQLVEINNDIK